MHRLHILITLFILGAICLRQDLVAADYHVAPPPTGTDGPSRGSQTAPWATIGYAAGQVTTAGDTIHLAAGEYPIGSFIELSPGVSLIGADDSDPTKTVIRPTQAMPSINAQWFKETAIIFVDNDVSWQAVQPGDMTLSDFTIQVDEHAEHGILAVGLHDFRVLRVNVHNAVKSGIVHTSYWHDPSGWDYSRFATGCEIAHCFVESSATDTNPAVGVGGYSHNIDVRGWRGGSIHHNRVIDIDDGIMGGFGIGGNYNAGIKVHDNYIRTGPDADQWLGTFNFEFRDLADECEFYNNDMNACASMVGGGHLSSSEFNRALYFHHNTIHAPDEHEVQMIEAVTDHAEYAYNVFYGGGATLLFSNKTSSVIEDDVIDISVHHNLHRRGSGVFSAFSQGVRNDIRIYNNTFLDMTNQDNLWKPETAAGFVASTNKNWIIANNVIFGIEDVYTDRPAIFKVINGATLENFVFRNNYYGDFGGVFRRGDQSAPITLLDNIEGDDPQFHGQGDIPVPWYRPASGASPLVGGGVVLAELPDSSTTIGAYELDASDLPPTVVQVPSADPETVTGTSTQLSVLVSDPEGAAVTYTWTLADAPTGSDPRFPSGSREPTVVFDLIGSYRFAVSASDGTNQIDAGQVTVTVQPQASGILVAP